MYSKLGSIVFFVVGEEKKLVPQANVAPRPNPAFVPSLTDSFDPRRVLLVGFMARLWLAWPRQRQRDLAPTARNRTGETRRATA